MSLDGQVIPVQFSGGLDQKTTEQQVMPGKFLVLENCVRRKLGKIEKRYGYTQLGQTIIGGTSISQGTRLAKLNSDLLLINNTALYSYSSSNNAWIDKGDITSVLVDSEPATRNSYIQTMGDMDSMNGITVSAWEDNRGGVGLSVVDDETGSSIIYDHQVDAVGTKPKVVAANDVFVVMYLDTSDHLTCVLIDSATPTTVSAPVAMDATAFDTFDACSHGNYVICAAVPTGAPSTEIKVSYFNNEGTLGSGAIGLPTPTTITESAVDAVTIVSDYDNSKLYVAYKGSANDLKVTGLASHLLVQSTDTVENLANIRNVAACMNSSDALKVFYEVSAASGINHSIRTATATFDGTTTTASAAAAFARSVGLATKPFLQGTSTYVNVAFETDLQPTYFTLRDDGFIAARMLPGTGAGLTRDPSGALVSSLCRVVDDDSDHRFLLGVRLKLQADEDGSILSTAMGLERTTLSFGSANFFSDQVGQNLHISGGTLLAYDGVSATELGFHVYPELATGSVVQTVGGGSLSAGAYRVVVVYEWVDAQGQVHQSAPSIPQAVTVGANDRITVNNIPYLRLTAKTSPRAEVRVVLYRTAVDGIEVYYRDTDIANVPTLDVPAAAPVLSQSDADLDGKQVLYTVGGVLDNIAPPASRTAIRHKNRLVLGGTGDGSSLAYSKEFVFGEGVAFSDGFTIPVEPGSGEITALASMDDKLLIFKRDRVYAMVGDGPLETGVQNDYSLPQIITGDVGALNQASVVSTPAGIMFKSEKGIYLVSRSLEFQYIGAPVEDFNSLTVTSATLLEDINEVRFTTSDGECLVYNYYMDQWSTFTSYEAVSAVNALGAYCHLTADGEVRKESAGAFLDNGSRFSMAIETSWLAFAGVQGYQRLWRYSFLGDYVSDHYTRVKLAYDYEDAFVETVYFNVADGLGLEYYGDDVTYGDSEVYGGSGSGVYQFESTPRRQKCGAVRFRIEDVDTRSVAGGGSFKLASLTLEVGVKKGLTRQRGEKSIGSL